MQVSISGSDAVIINDQIIRNHGNGDWGTLEFPNDLFTLTTAKNGNCIYAFNESGKQATLVLRLLMGSPDDKMLNGLLAQMIANPAGFVLMSGQFIKRIGDGNGNISSNTYILSGGVFQRAVNAKGNAEGDVEQSVAVYTLIFSTAPRAIR